MSSDIRLAFSHPSERSEATAGPELRDRISLRDHIREVEIGAFQSERGLTQRICFNIVVEVTLPEMLDDDVDKILSYDTITDAIDRELSTERLNLLETLAERVAEDILADPRAARVFVRIEKLDRGPGALGVEIVRDRDRVAAAGSVEEVLRPCVVHLDNAAIHDARLPKVLDRFQGLGAPVILTVGPATQECPDAGNASAQRRIDLLAIEQNAWVLAGRDKRCVVVATRTEFDWSIKQGQISVWAPSKIVLDATDSPNAETVDSWQLTQWFAGEFDAQHVWAIGPRKTGEHMSIEDALSQASLSK